MVLSIQNASRSLLLIFSVLALAGCATWSAGDVRQSDQQLQITAPPTDAQKVILMEGDIADHKYVSLGDITVTVNKTTLFHSEPTKEQVNQKLKEKAAALGADAVILVRYGEGGVNLLSWGGLEGRGRAIKY